MLLEKIPAKKGFLKDFMCYIPNDSMERRSTTDGVVFFTLSNSESGSVGGVTAGKEHCGMLLLEANFSDWLHPVESNVDWMACK